MSPRPALSRTLLCAAALSVACAKPGITGRTQFLITSVSDDQKLGQQVFERALKDNTLAEDGPQRALVERVGKRIAAATGRPWLAWEFKLVADEQTADAVCLPGGKVLVYSGLLALTQDEDGLAAALAHVTAHAIARHDGERLSQRFESELGAQVAQIGVERWTPTMKQLALDVLDPDPGKATPFSRSFELEADRIGLPFLARAGYDPGRAHEFWDRVMQAGTGTPRPLFATLHPVEKERLDALDKEVPAALKLLPPGAKQGH